MNCLAVDYKHAFDQRCFSAWRHCFKQLGKFENPLLLLIYMLFSLLSSSLSLSLSIAAVPMVPDRLLFLVDLRLRSFSVDPTRLRLDLVNLSSFFIS